MTSHTKLYVLILTDTCHSWFTVQLLDVDQLGPFMPYFNSISCCLQIRSVTPSAWQLLRCYLVCITEVWGLNPQRVPVKHAEVNWFGCAPTEWGLQPSRWKPKDKTWGLCCSHRFFMDSLQISGGPAAAFLRCSHLLRITEYSELEETHKNHQVQLFKWMVHTGIERLILSTPCSNQLS